MNKNVARPRVLLVDDYPDAREMYSEYLEFCGFEVVEPFIAFAPGRRGEAERHAMLADYAGRLLNIGSAPVLPRVRSRDYEHFVLKRSGIADMRDRHWRAAGLS